MTIRICKKNFDDRKKRINNSLFKALMWCGYPLLALAIILLNEYHNPSSELFYQDLTYSGIPILLGLTLGLGLSVFNSIIVLPESIVKLNKKLKLFGWKEKC